MKNFYKIRNVLHRKIGYLELDITLKALFWASQIVSEGGAAGIIEIWTSETCRQKKINCNRAEFLHGSIICHNEARDLVEILNWSNFQKSCRPIFPMTLPSKSSPKITKHNSRRFPPTSSFSPVLVKSSKLSFSVPSLMDRKSSTLKKLLLMLSR